MSSWEDKETSFAFKTVIEKNSLEEGYLELLRII
jgi:hypothetical protein